MTEVQIILRPENLPQRDHWGAAPFWSYGEQALYWVDLAKGRLFRHAPFSDDMEMWGFPASCSAAVPARKGGLLLALPDGLYRFDPEAMTLAPLAEVQDSPHNRIDMTRCDPQGRILVASSPNEAALDGGVGRGIEGGGTVWRLGSDLRAEPLAAGLVRPNALAWSPDGQRLYVADVAEGAIRSFDANGAESGETFTAQIVGAPEGVAVDEAGFLWVACCGAGKVVRYAPDGTIDRELDLPVTQPSGCAFGGPGRNTLFITSAQDGLEDPGELDGALLAVEVEVAGLKMTPFEG